jgi:quinol monooxygenase YgiN
MAQSVKVVVKITVRPEKTGDARRVLAVLAEKSRAETGCVRYEVLQSASEPNVFALLEEWENAAALEAHVVTPHVHQAYAQAGAVVAEPPDRTVYRTIG